MRAWVDVVELTNTKTLNGGLVARCAAGLPFLLKEGIEVAFVPPVLDAPRRAKVVSVHSTGSNEAVVSFTGIDGVETASLLAGCHCLVRRADLPADVSLSGRDVGWEGFLVYDAAFGLVGRVTGVRELPAQLLLEVHRQDAADLEGKDRSGEECAANAATALIPLVDAFVVEVDEENRCLHMDLPAGLLDL